MYDRDRWASITSGRRLAINRQMLSNNFRKVVKLPSSHNGRLFGLTMRMYMENYCTARSHESSPVLCARHEEASVETSTFKDATTRQPLFTFPLVRLALGTEMITTSWQKRWSRRSEGFELTFGVLDSRTTKTMYSKVSYRSKLTLSIHGVSRCCGEIMAGAGMEVPVYLSVNIHILGVTFAPATGTPEAGGWSTES